MNTVNTRTVIRKYAELKVTDPGEDKRGEFAGMSVRCLVGNSTRIVNQVPIWRGYCSNAIRNYREDAASIMATTIFNKRDNQELVQMIIESVQESTRFKDITSRLVDIKSKDLEVIEKEALPYYDTSLEDLDKVEKTAREKNDVDTLIRLVDTFYNGKSRKVEKDFPRAWSLYEALPQKSRPQFFETSKFSGFKFLPYELQKKILVESEVDEFWVSNGVRRLMKDVRPEPMDGYAIRASKFIDAVEKQDFDALECLVKKCHTLFVYSWKQFSTIIELAQDNRLPKVIAENIHEIDASIVSESQIPEFDWKVDYKGIFPNIKRIRPPVAGRIDDNPLFTHVFINNILGLNQLCKNADRLKKLESVYLDIHSLFLLSGSSFDRLVDLINRLPKGLKLGFYECTFNFFNQITARGQFLDRIEYLELGNELPTCTKERTLPTMANLRHLKLYILKQKVTLGDQPRLIDIGLNSFSDNAYIEISNHPKLKAIRIESFSDSYCSLGHISYENKLVIHDLPNLRVLEPARHLSWHFNKGSGVGSNCPKLASDWGMDEQDDY